MTRPPRRTRRNPAVAWLQPVPDTMISPDADDPATIAATRDSVRLALIASLQHLPSRQRAVLILYRSNTRLSG